MRKLIAGLLLGGFANYGAADQAMQSAEQRCSELATAIYPETKVDTAVSIGTRGELPDFCEVIGTVAKRIRFALQLPNNTWNGKFVVTGCNGFCGSLPTGEEGYSRELNAALKLGYAAITSDGGHQAPTWSSDWAMQDPVALELYAGAWLPKVVVAGRALVSRFYQNEASRTYFTGCANGGRLGLFAAQRYPELFDGIAAGDAIFDVTGNAGVNGLWLLQSVRDEQGQPIIAQHKIPLLSKYILQQCDALDTVEDGIVARPRLCQPNLDELQCSAEQTEDCFSRTELRAIKRLYRGATAFGEQQFVGLPPGSERLWPVWVIGSPQQAARGERTAESTLRLSYQIPSDQPFNPHAYKLADELENLQRLAPILNAVDPDLRQFAATGGKLLYYHGLADPLVLPGRAIQYYIEVVAEIGKQELDKFGRFLFIPGHGHCWETPGQVPDEFSPLTVIDQWVERGEAPDRIIAVQKNPAGEVQRSRPLCAYPKAAVFQGGDDKRAENYRCE